MVNVGIEMQTLQAMAELSLAWHAGLAPTYLYEAGEIIYLAIILDIDQNIDILV